MLQAWSPAGIQAVDQGVHPPPPGASGVGMKAVDCGMHGVVVFFLMFNINDDGVTAFRILIQRQTHI